MHGVTRPVACRNEIVSADAASGIGVFPLCREVVQNDVDLLPRGALADHLAEESNKLFTGVAGSRFAQHFAGFCVQGGIQRERAVTIVLETMALGPAGRERQQGIKTIQSLNGSLFVDAKKQRRAAEGLDTGQ